MEDDEILQQLRHDIFEVFPPGPQRDAWLEWLAHLAVDSFGGPTAVQTSRTLH
jgi:hypothetical protein